MDPEAAPGGIHTPSANHATQGVTHTHTHDLLDQTVDRLLEITGAERGLVLVVEDGEPHVQTACFRRLDASSASDISQSIVREAIQASDLIVSTDAPEDPRFQASQSIADYNIRSVLCMPLKSRSGDIIGAVYADHGGVEFFSPADAKYFEAFGHFAGIALENALRYEGLQVDLERLAGIRTRFGDMVGSSPSMQSLYDLIDRLSDADVTVLIHGETGTGKGLIARALHARSSRCDGPFLAQNCGAFAKELLESELFGHCKGAYTGATGDRAGLFEAAHGGTLFLDEIGDAPLEVQVRLLHVLEDGAVRRIGENTPRKVDVRIIAATKRHLETEVEEGRFREDLYYRLRVVPLTVPPLRERPEDIPLLADHFLDLYGRSTEIPVQGFDPMVMKVFCQHKWPGNIRELENEIRRGVVLAGPGGNIAVEHLSDAICHLAGQGTGRVTIDGPLKSAVEHFERGSIVSALEQNGGNVTRTAAHLGLTRAGLQGKMRRLGIKRHSGG